MKNECSIVRDILPLYIENMVSDDTATFVEEHLNTCKECRAEYEIMKKPLVTDQVKIEATPIKKIKTKLLINKVQAVLLAIALATAVFFTAFSYLTTPIFFPYTSDLLMVTESEDKSIIVSFDERVTGYSLYKFDTPEQEIPAYQIEAWATIWDKLFSMRGKQNAIIYCENDQPITVFYSQNHMDGTTSKQDVLIYGEIGRSGGGASMPGIGFWNMLLAAAVAFIVGCIAWLLFRKRKRFRIWVERITLLPVSYVIGHLCVLGFRTMSYSAFRDFCLIVLIGLLVYCAMIFLLNIIYTKIEINQIGGDKQ